MCNCQQIKTHVFTEKVRVVKWSELLSTIVECPGLGDRRQRKMFPYTMWDSGPPRSRCTVAAQPAIVDWPCSRLATLCHEKDRSHCFSIKTKVLSATLCRLSAPLAFPLPPPTTKYKLTKFDLVRVTFFSNFDAKFLLQP